MPTSSCQYQQIYQENIIDSFTNIKEHMIKTSMYYLHHFSDMISQHYSTIILNANFFHYATESILIEVIKNNMDTSDGIKTCTIDEVAYEENLKLLTGSCYLPDLFDSVSQQNISTIFLEKFNKYKTSPLNKTEDFEAYFTHVTLQAASETISMSNLIKWDPLFLYNEFISCKQSDVFSHFINKISHTLKYDIKKDKAALNLVRLFYFLSKTKYRHYLTDIRLFNEHSSTLFAKIRKYSTTKTKELSENLHNILTQSEAYKSLKRGYDCMTELFLPLTSSFNETTSSLTKYVGSNGESFNFDVNAFLNRLNMSKVLLCDRIMAPTRNMVVMVNQKCVSLLFVNTSSQSYLDKVCLFLKEKADALKEGICEVEKVCQLTRYEMKKQFIDLYFDNTRKIKESVEMFCEEIHNRMLSYYNLSRSFIGSKYQQFLCLNES